MLKPRKTVLLLAKNTNTHSLVVFSRVLKNLGLRVKVSDALCNADLVVNRKFGMGYDDTDLDELEAGAYLCLNPVSAQRICRDKWLTFNWLVSQGVEQPPTFLPEQFQTNSPGAWMLKTRRGMQGRGVAGFARAQQAFNAFVDKGDKRYLFQKRLDFQREIRSYHLGENIFWYTKSGGSLYQGGSGKESSDIPASIREMACKIQKGLGARLLAVDFLVEGAKAYPVDVNCYPGLKLVEHKREALARLFQSCGMLWE